MVCVPVVADVLVCLYVEQRNSGSDGGRHGFSSHCVATRVHHGSSYPRAHCPPCPRCFHRPFDQVCDVWSGFSLFLVCFCFWMRCPWLWIVLCAFATMGSTVSGYHYYQCTFAESSFGWVFFWGWWYEGKWIRVWGVGEEGLGFRQLADNVEGDSGGIGIWLQGGTWSLTSCLE